MKRLLLALLLLAAPPLYAAKAKPAPAAPKTAVWRVGYLENSADARYDADRTELEYPQQPWGRPYAAAEQALRESRFAADTLHVTLTLERREADSVDALAEAAEQLIKADIHFAIADVDAATLAALSRRLRGQPLTLLNVSAPEDSLRDAECSPQLFHVIASQRQLADAVAQWLAARKWKRVLLLQGPLPADAVLAAAAQRALKRFGLQLVDTRGFVPGDDPRDREHNDVALLTGGRDYDAVWIADSDGEFAQRVPYRTQLPRPVVGSNGLVPASWDWRWRRDGAAQLNNRLRQSLGRYAGDVDWAAWLAVKALVAAKLAAPADDVATLAALRSDTLKLDGFKGVPLSFRAWDRQLRQPVFLASGDAVAGTAPLEGFLDPYSTLDTLGTDARESQCKASGVAP